MNPIELTARLVDVPSVTGTESEVAELLEKICIAARWSVERQRIDENRWNIFVNWKSRVSAAFCTHIDTVPPHFGARIDATHIHGRGACDTKGIIASMLAAGERLDREGLTPSFLFVVGEETDSIGAKSAATSGRSAKYLIVGEPTENLIARAHKGVLSYRLRTVGKSCHSGYPELGLSALHSLLPVLNDILNADWGHNEEIGSASTNIGKMSGGTAPNVLAEEAEAFVLHRIVDSLENRKDQAIRIINGRCEVEIKAENEPQRMYVPGGYDSRPVSFGTDIPYLRAIGTPLLVGPGSIHDAHTMEERIEIRQIFEAIELYSVLYRKLLKE
jgi:acetylornithine deacetylase